MGTSPFFACGRERSPIFFTSFSECTRGAGTLQTLPQAGKCLVLGKVHCYFSPHSANCLARAAARARGAPRQQREATPNIVRGLSEMFGLGGKRTSRISTSESASKSMVAAVVEQQLHVVRSRTTRARRHFSRSAAVLRKGSALHKPPTERCELGPPWNGHGGLT
jgi:hypothetical protein